MNSAPASFSDIFLGRQPLIDRSQAVIGYELLFRDTHENVSHITSARAATADVVCKAFAEFGLLSALGDQKAFINVDEDFLCDDAVEFLPKEIVLLELDASTELSPRLIERCNELRQIGYEFSVSGITQLSESLQQILRLASYSKMDVNAVLPGGNISAIMSGLRASQTKLIANRVESVEEKKICTDLGFDIFQGYYFAHPIIVEGRRLDASFQGLIRLINMMNENADLAKIESAFKGEPGLSINLLRLTNSASAGLNVRISSIRHALTVVGLRQIQRWLALLVFSHAGSQANLTNNPLLQLAALRGCFMELLAYRCFPAKRDLRDPAFITGLMSFMPAALGMSMADILSQISTTNEVRLALANREGDLGLMLELTERYDNEDIDGTAVLLRRIGNKVTLQTLGLCLAETIAWVQQLGSEVD